MIRLEATPTFQVRRRKRWVALDIGDITYLLTPDEAVHLADTLVDHSERVQP